jgi:hypothetical protein
MAFRYSPKIVTDGLVLYLDAANTKSYVSGSTTWNDISRSNVNGTLVNGPTFNSGNGGSVVFDGTNDYVSSTLQKTPNNTSVQLWYKWNGVNQFAIITYIGIGNWSDPGIGLLLHDGSGNTSGNKVGVVIGGIAFNTIISSATLVNNVWTQLTFTRSTTLTTLYQNGLIVGTSVTTPDSQNTLLPIRPIGGTVYYPAGSFASVSIYDRALTSSEVLQNYNSTKSRFGLT